MNYEIIKVQTNNYSVSNYTKFGHQIHKTLGTNSLRTLTADGTNASANALFKRDGTVYEIIPPHAKKRAWTAGRISQPSDRAKNIMLKTLWGTYIKPGYYLWQWEFECLANETYTEAQYNSFIEYCKKYKLPIIDIFFLTHKDTARFKPDLEKERAEILRRAKNGIIVTDKEKLKKEIISLVNKL